MQRHAAELDEIQRLKQAEAEPETWVTHKSFDTIQSSNDGDAYRDRKRKSLFSNKAPKKAKPGPVSIPESKEIKKQEKGAHGTDYDSRKSIDVEISSHPPPRLSTTALDNVLGFIRRFVRMIHKKGGISSRAAPEVGIPRWTHNAVRHFTYVLDVYVAELRSVSVTTINTPGDTDVNDVTLKLFGAVLMQQYRAQIARSCSQYLPEHQTSIKDDLQHMGAPNFSPGRLDLNTKPVVALSKDHAVELSDVLDRPISDVELDHIMDLLASTNEMQLLSKCVGHCLYRDDNFAMQMIEAAMSKENLIDLHRDGYKARITVPWWSIQDFMYIQYGNISRFGSVVTLTGCSVQHAQASTCADYVKMTWPITGEFFLELLDTIHATIVASDAHESVQISLAGDRGLFVQVNISCSRSSHHCVDFVAQTTDEDLLMQLAQQFSWLSCAFSAPPSKWHLAYSNPLFVRTRQGSFEITLFHDLVFAQEQACWLPLFDGACIAAGFPISQRMGEIGLEVSLELLAGLSGARHVVEYEGGLVMKGFSHMFVPIRRRSDRVQWHAVSSPDGDTPLSYHDGISRCKSRAMLHEVGLQDLASLRAIVGWCSVATTCLGSSCVDYGNIDYTKTSEADSGPRCTGTSFGFQQIGVASLDVRFGLKDGKSHFQRAGPYERTIQLAEGSPIVLHDVEGRRSWLVPATNVMLHIVQHRHHLNPFQVEGKPLSLDTTIAAGSSAKEALLKYRTQVLYEDDNYTFMDDILNTWSILELLLDQNISRQREAPGVRIPNPLHESLYGFEFKSVVNQDAVFKLKKTTISRNHGGWSKLIEDTDALVLFANGFGDVILPAGASNQDLCRKWRRVPHGKDYLTTTTNMLQILFDKAGSRKDRKYLTTKSKLRWHQGSSALFNGCQDMTTCDCTRLQQLIPESATKSAQPPTSIADEGAVIFGHPEPRSVPLRSTVPKISSSLYSQPNIPILPRIVRRRSDTNDERKGKIRRLDIEAEELSCQHNHRPQAMS